MVNAQVETMPDSVTIERLSTGFNRCFETLEAEDGIFADDAFFDMRPPFWRFQLEGADTFARQLGEISEGPSTARVLRVVPTATGFVLEHEETMRGAKPETAHRLWLCTVRDGLISEVVGYCNGGWDDELRARHAAEAPMVRP